MAKKRSSRKRVAGSTKRRYAFRQGHRCNVDPQIAGECLEQIRRKYGSLTSENTVSEAKEERHPLHGEFVWDDAIAGHRYRLVQARTLIRSVVVVQQNRPPRGAYVHVRATKSDDKENRYEPMETVVQQMDIFEVALAELESKMSAAIRAVEELRDMAKGSRHKDKAAIIAVVLRALNTASQAVAKIA